MQKSQSTWLSSPFGATTGSRLRWCGAYMTVITLCFAGPILGLIQLGTSESAYSHIVLIPLITFGMLRRPLALMPTHLRAAWPIAISLGLVAVGLLSLAYTGWLWGPNPLDVLSLRIAAYVILLIAGGFAALGLDGMRRILFPVAFSLFFIPMPPPMVLGIERFLQHASAGVAHLMFLISGETFLRDGLVFRLPGLSVEVARECSGIRSTLVLFITGLLAAKVLLRSSWRRLLLVGLVLPIAILRNGFRVWLLATLSVNVDPRIIYSPLHHQGGPLFFVGSLVLLLALAWMLMRSERVQASSATGGKLSAK